MRIVKSKDADVDWRGVKGETAGGVVSMGEVEAQEEGTPIRIPHLTLPEFRNMNLNDINLGTHYDQVLQFMQIYSLAQAELLNFENTKPSDIVTWISPQMDKWLRLALTKLTERNAGLGKEKSNEVLGMNPRINYSLLGTDTFASYNGNLHAGLEMIGTNPASVETDYNFRDKSIDATMESAFGLQWLEPGHVVTNVTMDLHGFGPLDTYKDQYANAGQMDKYAMDWAAIARKAGWTPPQ